VTTDADHRLPRTVLPHRYEVEWDVDTSAATFVGAVTIEADVVETCDAVVLHSVGLDITAAWLERAGSRTDVDVESLEDLEQVRLVPAAPQTAGPVEHHQTFGAPHGEHLTGLPAENFTGNRATDWGENYEPDALRAYTKRTGRKIKPGTYYGHPVLPWVGGTPDGLVGERGMIEAKCPLTFKNHLRTVITRTVPDEYLPQVLGHLWLSGRDWCDFVSYDPRIEGRHSLAIVRVNRKDHPEGIAVLGERITEFHDLLLEKLEKLKIKPGHRIPKQ
jgi:hypothetical protein